MLQDDMRPDIKESDWRRFKKLHAVALERFCEQVLREVARAGADKSKTPHKRYLEVFRLIQRRDRELADAFDDFRRSTAVRQLYIIRAYGLLTEAELSEFSPEVRGELEHLREFHRG